MYKDIITQRKEALTIILQVFYVKKSNNNKAVNIFMAHPNRLKKKKSMSIRQNTYENSYKSIYSDKNNLNNHDSRLFLLVDIRYI